MIYAIISEEEKTLLKKLIASKLVCFKSQEKDSWNHIFGNIALVTDKSIIEIRNELTPIEYYGDTEDVSKFYINQLSKENPFKLMIEDKIFETSVNENILDIIIAQDEVCIKDCDKKIIYEITIDTAIIVKTEFSVFVISREWSLEEELIFVKSTDYQRDIYSVQQMISEWGDNENWTTTCMRKFISLK